LKLIAKIRLNAPDKQRAFLLRTLEVANECANWISHQAWERKVFNHYALHRLLYTEARKTFPLSAQVVVRMFGKVADAYRFNKKVESHFSRHGAIAYDSRILSFRGNAISIWTLGGRQRLTYSAGLHQQELLRSQQGESDLIYHRGKWFLASTCDVAEPPLAMVDD